MNNVLLNDVKVLGEENRFNYDERGLMKETRLAFYKIEGNSISQCIPSFQTHTTYRRNIKKDIEETSDHTVKKLDKYDEDGGLITEISYNVKKLYSYNDLGKLNNILKIYTHLGVFNDSFVYDSNGRIKREIFENLDNTRTIKDYEYDNDNNKTMTKSRDGKIDEKRITNADGLLTYSLKNTKTDYITSYEIKAEYNYDDEDVIIGTFNSELTTKSTVQNSVFYREYDKKTKKLLSMFMFDNVEEDDKPHPQRYVLINEYNEKGDIISESDFTRNIKITYEYEYDNEDRIILEKVYYKYMKETK